VKISPLLAIFLVVLVDVFGMTLVLPLLGPYAERFHASPLQATLLVSVFAVCMLISGPILGSLSDRYGRKPLLLVSQLGTLIGFVLLARAQSLAMIFFSRALDGMTAGNLSLAQAFVSDHTEAKDRTKSFALIGIAFGLGFFMGPFVTSSLLRYGMTAPIWLAVALSALSIVCTAALIPSGPPAPGATGDGPAGRRLSVLSFGAYKPYFQRPELRVVLLQHLAYTLGFSAFTSGFSLFAERTYRLGGHAAGPREVGYVFGYAGFLGLIFQGGVLGRLTRKFGEERIIRSAFATNIAAYIVLASMPSVAGVILSTTLAAYGNGALRPAITSLASQRTSAQEQGTVLGLVQSLSSISAICGPMIGGLLLEHTWLRSWAIVPAICSLVGLVLSGTAHADAPKQQNETT
jgi:MFS family permease